jgi:cytochrome c
VGAAAGAFAFLLVGLVLSDTGRAQTPGSPKELFEKRCGGCHALDRDKEGPRLRGVYGRPAASLDSFPYSDALKRSKVVWTEDSLNRWLADTESLVPDNEMAFRVDKADERRAIINYLKQSKN